MPNTTNNTAKKASIRAMGKTELRAACKEAGIRYGKLTVSGMKDELAAVLVETSAAPTVTKNKPCGAQWPFAAAPKVEPVKEEVKIEASTKFNADGIAAIMGTVAPAIVKTSANVTTVLNGKTVDPNAAKVKSEPRTREEKNPAPIVPRASRKGYTIQKERAEQNGVKRPSEGTTCGEVWNMFDANPEIRAGELVALADDNGWNRTNVSCEFYAWRKFHGIKGRSPK